MTKEQEADKLKKLKALAERGVGGERESALKLYHKLLEKYQIDEGEILEERVTLHWFSYKNGTKVILFDIAVEAFFFFISAVVIILLIGAAGLVFIILREVAWYVRKQNEKKMEGKDNADGSF